jgi:hypothetical protein
MTLLPTSWQQVAEASEIGLLRSDCLLLLMRILPMTSLALVVLRVEEIEDEALKALW